MTWFKDKRSKITSMGVKNFLTSPSRGQEGMASIVVVSVLIIIMTLISLGFARIVSRVATNSADRQFSNSATYAAQSAINDVASYLKKYAQQAPPGNNFLPRSTKCNGPGTLIGSASPASAQGPFYKDSNLSGDTGRSTSYTCLLLNPTPSNLLYTQVDSLKSQVVKVNTSAVAGALDKLMISWQPSDTTITGYPVSASKLTDETTWNSSSTNCKDGPDNASCVPMLRLSIFPISNGETLSSAQSQSKTVFLYPQSPSGNVPLKPYTNNVVFQDGNLIAVPCTKTIGASDFSPSTASDFKCNIIISALSTAIAPASTDSVYLRLTPIYNQADIKISANDKFGDSLNFIGDQAIIDATAQTGGVAKRLQARVDTSSLAGSSGGIDTNISSHSDAIPEQSVRSANALCKRVIQTISSNGFASYVNLDDPDNVCHDLGSTTNVTNPVPKLTFNITGNNGQDSGKTVDSEANNPDSPQNPVQQGTVYVGAPGVVGNVTLNWSTVDARNCTASVGNAGDGWAGDKSGLMTFTGNPPINGTGAPQTFGGITSVTEYDLVCSRPGAPSTTPTKKVVAWPHPTVTLTTNPNPVTAGSNFDIVWTPNNTTNCSASSSNGSWTGNKAGSSGAHTESLPLAWNDNSSKTYTINCTDPIGRPASATIQICPGCGGPGQINENPPNCTADWNVVDNGNGTGTLTFDGACPPPPNNPLLGYYRFTDCSPDFVAAILTPNSKNCGDGVGNSASFVVGPGTYCANYWSGADPWGWLHQSGVKCFEVYAPMSIDFNSTSGVWDQGPECSYPNPASPYHWADNTWWCRAGRFPVFPGNTSPGCADGVHRWTTCDFWYQASGGSGNFRCNLRSFYGTFISNPSSIGGAYNTGGPFGWIDSGSPNPFTLTCVDNVTGNGSVLSKTIP